MTEDPNIKKKIERANSYREMMGTWAWKDFVQVLKELRQSNLEAVIFVDSVEAIQLARGQVKSVDTILANVGYILEEGGIKID